MTTISQSQKSVELTINHIHKHYGSFHALNDISLNVPPSALLTLLGPSGCGKSTLLRIIAGFVNASEGNILLDGNDVRDVPPFQRETAMVFQNYALFPHMTILDNVMFGLKMRKTSKKEALKLAGEALEMVKLSHLADRVPAQLSGGQQQRAALARALVTKPKILLLDEPFGALDKNLREQMQIELRKLQQAVGVTTVCVTHDQQEAMTISDYIAVMKDGRIEQLGTPLSIYDHPESHFVANFIGSSNMLSGKILSYQDGVYRILLKNGDTITLPASKIFPVSTQINFAIRPSSIRIMQAHSVLPKDAFILTGEVKFQMNLGNLVTYEMEIQGLGQLTVEKSRRPNSLHLQVGDKVQVAISSHDCVMLEPSHEK